MTYHKLIVLGCCLLLKVDFAQLSTLREDANVERTEAQTLEIHADFNEANKMTDDVPAFGEEMKLAQFNRFDSNYTFINHGSWGGVPNYVREKQDEMMELRDKNPNRFVVTIQYDLVEEARRALATFLGSAYANIIFVENVTKGTSNVLRSLTLAPGEAILVNLYTYPPMRNAAQAMVDRSEGTEMLELEHTLPIYSHDDIITQYTQMLTEHTNIKIAIIDHIAQPGIMFPLQELVDLCKAYGVLTLIDGAHAPGHIDMNLDELDADFYTGTLYKWAFGPAGSSFQWAAERHHAILQPAVTSFGYGDPYPENFRQQGTRDLIPFIVMPDAIDFFHWFGGQPALNAYRNEVWDQLRPMIDASWGAGYLEIPESMRPPTFLMPLLPEIDGFPPSSESSREIQNILFDDYHIQALVQFRQKMYVRISMMVYVTLEDCKTVVDAIVDLQARQKEKHLQLK